MSYAFNFSRSSFSFSWVIQCNSFSEEHGGRGWSAGFLASGLGLWVSNLHERGGAVLLEVGRRRGG